MANDSQTQQNNNLPFEVGYEKAKYNIAMAANQIASEYNIPGMILVSIMKEIAVEADLNAKNTMLAHYELVSPEELAEYKKAKNAVDKALAKNGPKPVEDE